MSKTTLSRHARIGDSIATYSRIVQKPVDENLLIDMVRDILWYGREEKISPQEVWKKEINNDPKKG